MSFDEVDELFYLLENPTRRRILQLLSVERLYPLQLSKEIDVTQQAVVKHLRILENHGLVKSRDEPSRRGPCLLYTSPSPRDRQKSRMPSSA